MKKKVLSLILAMIMVFGGMVPAFAASSGTCGDGVNWSFADGVLTISGSGAMKDYKVVKESTEQYISDVTNAPWASLAKQITSVVVKEGVTAIGDYAFYRLNRITSVTIADSVVSIGDSAFFDCYRLAGQLNLPQNLEVIGRHAFEGTAISGSLNLFGKVTEIGEKAFLGTSITKVNVPVSVETIGAGAFCTKGTLTAIEVSPLNEKFVSVDGVLYTADGKNLMQYPAAATAAEYEVAYGVESIDNYAFANTAALTSVKLPATVEAIGHTAFANCKALVSVYFDGKAPSVFEADHDDPSFDYDVTLYYIGGKEGWTDGKWNGYNTKTWSSSEIASGTCGDGLNWVIENDGTLVISGNGSVEDFEVTSYDGAVASTTAPWNEFKSAVTGIVVEDGVTSVGANAFRSCSNAKYAELGKDVESIGIGAFYGCKKLSVIGLSEGIEEIKEYALAETAIEELNIPSSAENIAVSALYDTDALKAIKVAEGNKAYAAAEGVLFTKDMKTLVKYPSAAEAEEYSVPAGVETVKANAFASKNLKKVNLPESVKALEYRAFAGCENLAEAHFEGNEPTVTAAGSEAATFASATTVYYPGDADWTVADGKWNGYTASKVGGSIPGDCNRDGKVSMADLLMLRKHLAGIEVDIDLDAANVTTDDKVSMADLLLLRKYLAGMNVELV